MRGQVVISCKDFLSKFAALNVQLAELALLTLLNLIFVLGQL